MSNNFEVQLSPTQSTQSGDEASQNERDSKPVSHKASYRMHIPRRPSVMVSDRHDGQNTLAESTESVDPAATTDLSQSAESTAYKEAIPHRPSGRRHGTHGSGEINAPRVQPNSAKRHINSTTTTPYVTNIAATPDVLKTSAIEEVIHSPGTVMTSMGTTTASVSEAPAIRVVRPFSIPRRPSTPRHAVPETPLPAVPDELVLDEPITLRIPAPETPLPAVPEAPFFFGLDSALTNPVPEILTMPLVQAIVAAPAIPKQETSEQTTTYDLSVIVPTRNEQNNIWPLLETLRSALWGMHVEVIFVDDSDDNTVEVIKDAMRMLWTPTFHAKVEHRLAGESRTGGLATAVVLGMERAHAEYVAIIDADLQHPPEQLRVFYDQATAQDADVVVASRYIQGGNNKGLAGVGRRFISVGLKWTAKLIFPGKLMRLSDPLSGFFLVRRSLISDISLRPVGYKILLELLLRCSWRYALEVPYHFRARFSGQSKSNMRQGLLTLQHMLRLWCEVPDAGRSWKIAMLLLLNVLVALMCFRVSETLPAIWSGLNVIAFGLMACLDFVFFNRYIFPTPMVSAISSGNVGSRTAEHALSPLVGAETVKLSSASMNDSNHHRLNSIAATETFKIPSVRQKMVLPSGLTRKFETLRMKISHERVQRFVAISLVVLAAGWIAWRQPGPPLVLAVLLTGLPLAFTKSNNHDQAFTMTLAIAVGVATIDYLSWRLVATNWSGWWISVPLLCAEVFGALHVLGFQFTVWPWSLAVIEQGVDPTRLPIFIFIPTANEGASILRPTIEGSIAARDKYLARYPHGKVAIVVCNDGFVVGAANWEEIDKLAREMGIACITRTKKGGAKAGNIENARQVIGATGDALLVIFDADQAAKSDFLIKTIPQFSDPKMGWVQTGQYYANLENPVSRWADDQQSMFYNLLCPGKAGNNAAFICGTNVVIRAAALDEIGGLPQDSVTEDFAASIALHSSWRSIYLKDILATGLGPLDVPSYLKQQSRWALGTLGVFRSHWREILLPKKHGLQLGQRIQYFLACTHYLCGFRDLIYLLCPLLFILTGIPAVRSTTLGAYLWHFLPYAVLSTTALWYSARGITGLRGIIIGFGSFPVLIISALSALIGRKVSFTVTAKQRSGKRSFSYLGVYCFFFLLCIACLIWATRVKGLQQTSLFISLLWVVYSLLMLGSFLWLNVKDLRFHASVKRKVATNEMMVNQQYASNLLKRRSGLNPLGNLGIAALLAAPILVSNSLGSLQIFTNSQPSPFMINKESITAPYLGLTLPVELLAKRPLILAQDLGTQFSIIGRTQDIHDRFDSSWANQLAAHKARPWINLQFGVFGPDQRPPLDANLPAISNGLHDSEIRRWAEDIRDYGKPIYLTILQHADRNWSLSSGVANGGIPQDVPKAWIHVQSIFRAVGATNVAWVWAPADPINDKAFAPPASTIDAVLQSFIDYPETQWGDPKLVLQGLLLRYPTKPIFVEASADGPAAQKAAWLTKLGQAVYDIPHVYALLYHEGGPALNPSSAQIESWSLASDPASLLAMRQVVINLHNLHSKRDF